VSASEIPTAALALLLVIAFAVLMLAGRHLTFFFDEWDFVLRRRSSTVGSFLAAHNGHIVLFEVAIYKALLATIGLRHYWPYQAVNTVLHLACVALVYVLARRRVGGWTALALAALLAFMGSAYQDLLWPFQIGWFASVAGGLGALALLEGPRRHDGWACLLLIVSLTGSAIGVAFVVAALVLILCDGLRWRRLWVIVIPAILFLIWYVGWGTSQQITSDAVLGAPQYIATAAGGAAAGLLGLDASAWGPPVLVTLLAALVVGFRARREEPPPRLALAAGIGALAFWLLISISRADFSQPDSSRYVYIGAVFLLLLAAEARLGAGLHGTALAAVILLTVGAIVANLGNLRTNERTLRTLDTNVRAALTAVQLAASYVSPTFQPDATGAPQITAGPYLQAERSIGSPAFTVSELLRAPASVQAQGDTTLAQAERLGAGPVSGLPSTGHLPVHVDAAYGGRPRRARGCDRFVPTAGATGSLDVRPGAGRDVSVRATGATVLLYLRRFAPTFTGDPLSTVPAHSAAALHLPADADPALPWHVQIVSPAPFTVCVGAQGG
jgi:hypothetical protein